jgi:hypothetical protein
VTLSWPCPATWTIMVGDPRRSRGRGQGSVPMSVLWVLGSCGPGGPVLGSWGPGGAAGPVLGRRGP